MIPIQWYDKEIFEKELCLLQSYDLSTVGLFYKIIMVALHLNSFFFLPEESIPGQHV